MIERGETPLCEVCDNEPMGVRRICGGCARAICHFCMGGDDPWCEECREADDDD